MAYGVNKLSNFIEAVLHVDILKTYILNLENELFVK